MPALVPKSSGTDVVSVVKKRSRLDFVYRLKFNLFKLTLLNLANSLTKHMGVFSLLPLTPFPGSDGMMISVFDISDTMVVDGFIENCDKPFVDTVDCVCCWLTVERLPINKEKKKCTHKIINIVMSHRDHEQN